MAQLLVRKLDDGLKAKLRQRAIRHGHSTEEEVRQILSTAVRKTEPVRSRPLGTRFASRFSGIGLARPIDALRGQAARPAGFSG